MLGIRRGEFVEIIRVSFPAESLTVVENRESISPYSNYQHAPARHRLCGVPPDLCTTGRMPVNECRW
jgi:hypothetical protein